MNRKLIVLLLILALGVAVVAGGFLTGADKTTEATAMTELNISNMTCGSCVGKVKDALGQIAGVGQAEVSVTNGRGQVTYDPALTSSTEIAQVVTATGFPATVRLDLSAAEYEKSLTENEQLSAKYVARIGNRLVSREDFNQLVSLRGAGLTADTSPYANQQLKTQVWQSVKEREILLAAADRNKIVIQNGEVDLEIKRMKKTTQNFDAAVVARFGSYERFFEQLKQGMIINRNIDQNVLAGLTDDGAKQQRFSQWYQEVLQSTNVVIFDPAIKLAESGGSSSCGSSCGGG